MKPPHQGKRSALPIFEFDLSLQQARTTDACVMSGSATRHQPSKQASKGGAEAFLHSISTVVVGISFAPGTASAQQQASDDMKVRVYGDAAVVTRPQIYCGTYKGEPVQGSPGVDLEMTVVAPVNVKAS
jgi:hypothetical protein